MHLLQLLSTTLSVSAHAFIFKYCRRLNFLPFFTSSYFVLDACSPASKGKQFFSSSDSEDDEESKKKFKIKIKPLVSDSVKCVPPSMDELKASVGGLALSPSLVSAAHQYSCSDTCCLCIYNSCSVLSLSFCLTSSLYVCLFFSLICRHLVEEKSGKPVNHFAHL